MGESFAEAHGLNPGDSLTAIMNGRQQRLQIVGIVLSPEYIIQVPSGSMMPDDKRFGVFWMSYRGLAEAFDMEGAFNDVCLTLMHGASEPEVIKRVDDLTEPYGAIGAYGRNDQISHRYISDEIRQLRSMGIIGPTIFISVATFLLNVVISRLINTQREQIAALKAFGYTKREIRWHYLKLVIADSAGRRPAGHGRRGLDGTRSDRTLYAVLSVSGVRLRPAVSPSSFSY